MERIIGKLVQEFEHGRLSRRELIQGLAALATSAMATSPAAAVQSEGRVFKATAFNHVSLQVADYRKARDFYSSLFGMKVAFDNGGECELQFGNNILIVRNRDRGMRQSAAQALGTWGTPRVDHIAYTIANWDTDKKVKGALEAELKRRGLKVRTTEPSAENRRFGEEPSFIVQDPDGFMLQMGGKEQ